jgi:hypothetical protein
MANHFSLRLSQMKRGGRPCIRDCRKTSRRGVPARSQDTGGCGVRGAERIGVGLWLLGDCKNSPPHNPTRHTIIHPKQLFKHLK